MDPKLTSITTSGVVWVAGILAGWLASRGLISAEDQVKVISAFVTLASVAGAWVMMWWKGRQHSQTALIAQVNKSPNGVKVVDELSPSPRVDKPSIGPGST